ncbi:MAG: hypothetical protein M0Z61_15245 [Nitrospiraceae bacterium]|nr:hypothetical protein [Nitrospiraceae bacterium]
MPEETASSLEDQETKTGGKEPAEVVAAAPQAEAAGMVPAKQGKSPGWLVVAAISLLVSITVSAGSVDVYDRFYAQKIVAVDIKGYIAAQRDLYLSGKETGKEFRANIDKLAAAVKSIPKNRVAIMGDAVVKNAEIEKLP